jgi:hypothetical protein
LLSPVATVSLLKEDEIDIDGKEVKTNKPSEE